MSGHKDTTGLLLYGIIAIRCFPEILLAQIAPSDFGIPSDALIIERAVIPPSVHRTRELVLWMISPQKHDRGPLSDRNPYTCPELTLGSYYEGPTRLSLVNPETSAVINTVKIVSFLSDGRDYFYVPYRIRSGDYYPVPGRPKGTEGKPALLALRDVNGDGLALEVAFFEAEACMGLPTTLVGYSPRQDKVMQYRAEMRVTYLKGAGKLPNRSKAVTGSWIDYLFAETPVAAGHWKYEIDYRGRLGTLDSYDIRYDQTREMFVGTLSRLCPGPPLIPALLSECPSE